MLNQEAGDSIKSRCTAELCDVQFNLDVRQSVTQNLCRRERDKHTCDRTLCILHGHDAGDEHLARNSPASWAHYPGRTLGTLLARNTPTRIKNGQSGMTQV